MGRWSHHRTTFRRRCACASLAIRAHHAKCHFGTWCWFGWSCCRFGSWFDGALLFLQHAYIRVYKIPNRICLISHVCVCVCIQVFMLRTKPLDRYEHVCRFYRPLIGVCVIAQYHGTHAYACASPESNILLCILCVQLCVRVCHTCILVPIVLVCYTGNLLLRRNRTRMPRCCLRSRTHNTPAGPSWPTCYNNYNNVHPTFSAAERSLSCVRCDVRQP